MPAAFTVTPIRELLHQNYFADARCAWQDYYRSVRILRRIRRENLENFLEFSNLWWKSAYEQEDPKSDARDMWKFARKQHRQRRLP